MTRAELTQNAFFVLNLAPTASRMEVERAGQKLLAQLAIGATSAQTYQTPFGSRPRDEGSVRTALAVLRDPEQRLRQEFWAETGAARDVPEGLPAFEAAPASVGWRGPWPG